MKEHKKNIKNNSKMSREAKHTDKEKHYFDFENAETLSLENNCRRTIIKECLFNQETAEKSLTDAKCTLNVFV